jgi:hypothetical protein
MTTGSMTTGTLSHTAVQGHATGGYHVIILPRWNANSRLPRTVIS